MNPLDIMRESEATKRLHNPLQYKFNALVCNYSDSDTKHKGSDDIITDHKNKLAWLKEIEAKINEEFSEEFPDEPTDEDFKALKKESRVYTLIEDEDTRGEFGVRVWKDEQGHLLTERYNETTGYWDVE